jgi:predicted 3-demethylubiquinone-9 3-methyltransferase (glyoxalase superfamily)
MPKITTFLTYEKDAEGAVDYYASIFKNSKVGKKTYYGEGTPMPKGTVMTIEFELEGIPYVALNGGEHFQFTDAMSLAISVETQQEVDYFTDKLIANGGEEMDCGWVRDRWGLRWQVTPKILMDLINSPDKAKATKAFEAMMKMKRINIAEIKRAAGL